MTLRIAFMVSWGWATGTAAAQRIDERQHGAKIQGRVLDEKRHEPSLLLQPRQDERGAARKASRVGCGTAGLCRAVLENEIVGAKRIRDDIAQQDQPILGQDQRAGRALA